MRTKDRHLLIFIMILSICLLPIFIFKSYMDYCSYTYEKEVITGIVSGRESHTVLINTLPVTYNRIYTTQVILSDDSEITLYGATVYYSCDIGDEILVEVVYKYRDGYLVSIDYKTVDSTKVSITQEKVN